MEKIGKKGLKQENLIQTYVGDFIKYILEKHKFQQAFFLNLSACRGYKKVFNFKKDYAARAIGQGAV